MVVGAAVDAYDRHVGRYGPELAIEMVRVAGVRAGQRALDVGSGTGALTVALAAVVGAERVAAEMRRVTRPGGVLSACVWDFERGMTMLRAVWDSALEVDAQLARSFGAEKRNPFSRPHDLWYPFANGVGNLGRFHDALDEPRRERFKRGVAERLGSPSGRFRLTATAWCVRGTVPAGPCERIARMRRLEFVGPRRLEFREVTEPRIESDDQVIVRPVASTTCDLDRAIIAGATPFRGPFAIGHECVAEVVDVGDDAGVIPGARVVVPWHPCCTVCAACVQGRMADCERVPRFAMYGVPLGGDFGGLFDDLVLVPFGAALVPVPDGVAADAVASASDNLSDAYGGVSRALATRPNGSVLVLGGTGSIGQWAAGWAVMLGAARTVYVDRDEESRGLAEGYGATAVASLDELDRAAAFDVLIDAGAHAGRLADAIGWLGAGGHCHSVGIYFEPTTGLPLGSMYMNGISFSTGRPSVSPVLGEVLLAVAEGRFDPSPVFSDRLPFDDAAAALAELPRKAVFVR